MTKTTISLTAMDYSIGMLKFKLHLIRNADALKKASTILEVIDVINLCEQEAISEVRAWEDTQLKKLLPEVIAA